MNTIFRSLRRWAAPIASVLLLAGCLQERLCWSPDGSRAAVLTADGLYLCDAAGNLSPLLLPRAYRVAWLGDSQRLVVAHSREIKDFASLAAALGPERTRMLTVKAESVWQQVLPLKTVKDLPSTLIKPDDDLGGITLYLREKYHAALKEKAGDEWKNIESLAAEWHTLAVARVIGDRIEFGAVLHEGLAKLGEIRPAPGSSVVAFVTHIELSPESDDSRQILLSPIDGTSPARVLARQTSAHADWSPDGRTLYYFKSEGHGSTSGDDLRLGTLTSSRVLDASGKIAVAEKSDAHAGLIFHDGNRVRTLRDGRVVFDAGAFRLPISGKDRDAREEFFVVDPATDTVMPLFSRERIAALPHSLANFELSPDDKQMLVADGDGKVWLLTLADQKVELINEGASKDDSIAPAWRLPGEFTYRKKSDPRAELIQRRGSTETVLSRTWPDEVMQQLTK